MASIYICAGVAVAGLLAGNRTALPLLMGLGFSLAAKDVPMPWYLYVAIDAAIIAAIWPLAGFRDRIIAGLFPIAWAAYFSAPPFYQGVPYVIVCLQLLLCSPLPWVQRGDDSVSHGPLRELNYEGV